MSRGGVWDPGVGSPEFTGVEGDQRWGISSGVEEMVGGIRRGSVQVTGVQGAKPLG